jgi:hypothetical protein
MEELLSNPPFQTLFWMKKPQNATRISTALRFFSYVESEKGLFNILKLPSEANSPPLSFLN